MPTSYPGALDTHPNPTSATYQDDAGFEADVLLSNLGDALDAIEAKVGVGGANQAPVTGRILGADGAGTSSWRQLATADILANAITQIGMSDGGTADPTTTSTSYVDLSSNSVTLTTTGGPCLVIASATLTNNVSGSVLFFGVNIDGGSVLGERTLTIPANNSEQDVTTLTYSTPSSGAHTWRMRWSTNSNTAKSPGARRTLIVVELKR